MPLYPGRPYCRTSMESTSMPAQALFNEKASGGLTGERERSLCVECKGRKMLCAKTRCPLLVKYYAAVKQRRSIDSTSIFGSAPGVFVGRYGYPAVSAGPLLPPIVGDTSELDTPEIVDRQDHRRYRGHAKRPGPRPVDGHMKSPRSPKSWWATCSCSRWRTGPSIRAPSS